MSDCKLITIQTNLILTNRQIDRIGASPNSITTVSDNPNMEKVLNSYLKQGYQIADRFQVEPHYFTFLLLRDN